MRARTVFLALCALALLGAPAEARFRTAHYTYSTDSGCKDPIDPINAVFYGKSATWQRTSGFITKYAGWENGDGSDQNFKSGRHCRVQAIQRASGGNASSRFHIRLSQVVGRDRKHRRATVGDAHHEDLNVVTNCFPAGHAVDKGTADDPTPNGSGFDQGRAELAGAFRAKGRKVSYQNWGNTRAFEQCDGDLAGSDGLTALMTIPKPRKRR
jgi:hypothetical protein